MNRLNWSLLAVSLCTWGVSMAPAQIIWYVNDDAPGADTGTTWVNAYRDLQDAIDVAEAGDQIWVATGVYRPSFRLQASSPRSSVFPMKNGVHLYGGFAGGEVTLMERAGLFAQTVLSGDLGGNDGPDFANRGDNTYHVVYGNGADATAVLDGFTITAGYANGSASTDRNRGGGLFSRDAGPSLRNCILVDNWATQGGGAYLRNAHCEFTQCEFRDNRATQDGGAMYNRDAAPTLTDCEVRGNIAYSETTTDFPVTAYGNGGGIYNNNSNAVVSNSLFTGNQALGWGDSAINSPNYGWGGAMVNSGSDPIVTDCQFIANIAEGYGAGMQSHGGAHPTVRRCLFQDNENLGTHWWHTGGAAMNFWSAAPTAIDCTFMNNAADHGGAIHSHGHGEAGEWINCRFIDNHAAFDRGGALYAAEGTHYHLVNCLFTGNTANWGGAVFILTEEVEHSPTVILNSTFHGNESAIQGGGGVWGGSETVLHSCIFWNNRLAGVGGPLGQLGGPGPWTVTHNTIEGWTGDLDLDGLGNFSLDPLFVNVAGGDFHLSPESGAIDAGEPFYRPDPEAAFDLSGAERVQHCRVDQGAYEASGFADCNANRLADACETLEERAADCDMNLVPDECQPDCNENLVADACDLISGTSGDCDTNHVPDECESVDCNENGAWDICDLLNGTSPDVNATHVPDECEGPLIVHQNGFVGQTRPFSGYSDPRGESSNGIDLNRGIDRVTFVFNQAVFAAGGGPVGPASFEVTETGAGSPPRVASVDAGLNPRIEVQLSRPLTLREWTTVRAVVQNAAGLVNLDQGNLGAQDEFDRIDLGFLPADIDQSDLVTPIDLLRFRQGLQGVLHVPGGLIEDYIDTDRSGVITPLDLLRFRQLLQGASPATQSWSGVSMNHARP